MKRPAARRRVEDPLHIAILRYLRATLPHGFVIQHTPNKPRSMQQGAREKAMGALAGWPDLSIYGPGEEGPSVWFVEVKPKAGRVSLAQHDMHDRLRDAGFCVGVARSVPEAANLVAQWGLPSRDASISRQQAAE